MTLTSHPQGGSRLRPSLSWPSLSHTRGRPRFWAARGTRPSIHPSGTRTELRLGSRGYLTLATRREWKASRVLARCFSDPSQSCPAEAISIRTKPSIASESSPAKVECPSSRTPTLGRRLLRLTPCPWPIPGSARTAGAVDLRHFPLERRPNPNRP